MKLNPGTYYEVLDNLNALMEDTISEAQIIADEHKASRKEILRTFSIILMAAVQANSEERM